MATDPNLASLQAINAAAQQQPPQPTEENYTGGKLTQPPPDQTQQQQPQAQAPTPPRAGGMPNLVNLISQLIHPTAPPGQMLARGSRLDAFENFLSTFVTSLGQGLAQSGHGPGANLRGAGAAISAPYNLAMQQYQMQQQTAAQQSQLQTQELQRGQIQAQTELERAQAAQMTNVVMTPYGPMSQALAAKVFPAAIAAQGRVQAAGTEKRFINTPSGIFDTESQNFVPGGTNAIKITPELAAQYGFPDQMVGKTIPYSMFTAQERAQSSQMGIASGAAGPALVNKQTAQTTPLGLGSPAANPVAQARLGLAQQTFERDTFGTNFGKSIPSSLVDQSGSTMGWKSPSAPTANEKTQAQQSQDLATLFNTVKQKIQAADKAGKLGPYAGRMNELMTGTVGANDPQFAELRALGSLTASGMLKAHFGARGGQQMYGHFEDLFNTGKMTSGDLIGALNGFSTFMNQYAQRVRTAGQAGGGKPGGGKPADISTMEHIDLTK